MLETVENLIGLEIYAPNGLFVGVIDEMIIGIDDMTAYGMFVKNPNPALADEGISISIPMRWVQSVGDIVILNAFPERITLPNGQ